MEADIVCLIVVKAKNCLAVLGKSDACYKSKVADIHSVVGNFLAPQKTGSKNSVKTTLNIAQDPFIASLTSFV